ncbi:MAG: hypothetical protein ACI9WU_000184 [Myxococcota bacterium]|jgi:hypothetical protein
MQTQPHQFTRRLNEVVRELDTHPAVRVTCFHVGPPARASALRRLERRLGGTCDPGLEALYREANGVQLRWRVTTPSERQIPHPREAPAGLARIDLLDMDGCVNLLSIEQMLEGERCLIQSSSNIRIGGRKLRGRVARRSVLFDGFSGFASTILVHSPPGGWRLATLYDFGLSVPEDGVGSVQDYLEHLLVTRGLMIARTRSYCQRRGIPLPQLPSRWRRDRRALDGLVSAALEGW